MKLIRYQNPQSSIRYAAPVGSVAPAATFVRGSLLDQDQFDSLFVRHMPGAVIHLASLLSGSRGQDRARGWQVNLATISRSPITAQTSANRQEL